MRTEQPTTDKDTADFDLVIAHGSVVDGTGRPRYRADLGIRNGRVAAITHGGDGRLSGRQTIDATGRIVAPGFVDSNSHADWVLPRCDHPCALAPLLLQGVTTVVGGGCGFSPAPVLASREAALNDISGFLRDERFRNRRHSFAEFLDVVERDGLMLNAAFLVGQNTLRTQVLGDRAGAPTPRELDTLRELTRQALRDGAVGLSGNLAFAPGLFATRDEMATLVRIVAEEGATFAVHARSYMWRSQAYRPRFFGAPHNLRSVREMIALARETGVRLQYSHLLFAGRRSWRTHRAVLQELDRGRREGADLGFDAFPYTVGNAPIQAVFPDWFLDGFLKNLENPAALRRLRRETLLIRAALGMRPEDLRLMTVSDPDLKELEGLDFAAIARRLEMSPLDAEVYVAHRTRGAAAVLLGALSGDAHHEDALRAVLSHPLCAIITNAILPVREGRCHNPAAFGAFPRVLGRYSRDLGLFPLEEAVRRMTSYPAERLGLAGTGRIAEGYWADIVVFDPREVRDNGRPEHDDLPPSGIDAVLVSGELAAYEGRVVPGVCRGRVLRRQ